MRCFFTAIAAALLLAALSGVALAWDGSYFLFSTLDLQSPFLVYGRLAHCADLPRQSAQANRERRPHEKCRGVIPDDPP